MKQQQQQEQKQQRQQQQQQQRLQQTSLPQNSQPSNTEVKSSSKVPKTTRWIVCPNFKELQKSQRIPQSKFMKCNIMVEKLVFWPSDTSLLFLLYNLNVCSIDIS